MKIQNLIYFLSMPGIIVLMTRPSNGGKVCHNLIVERQRKLVDNVPKLLNATNEDSILALETIMQLDYTPEELEGEMDVIIKGEGLEDEKMATKLIIGLLHSLPLQVELLHSTHKHYYLGGNLTKEFSRFKFSSAKSNHPIHKLLDWLNQIIYLTTREMVDLDTVGILIDHLMALKNFKLAFKTFLSFTMDIVTSLFIDQGGGVDSVDGAATPPPLLEENSVSSLEKPIKCSFNMDELYKVLSSKGVLHGENLQGDHLKLKGAEWYFEFFNEATPINSPNQVKDGILAIRKGSNFELVDSFDNDHHPPLPVNYLLNMAYLLNFQSKRAEALTLVAAALTSTTRHTTDNEPSSSSSAAVAASLPSPSLLGYYDELGRMVKEPIDDTITITTAQGQKNILINAKEYNVKAKELSIEQKERNHHLWIVEKGFPETIKKLVKSKPKERSIDDLMMIVGKVLEGNKVEGELEPVENHSPKFWINEYYLCMARNLLECSVYFCAAGITDSIIQDISLDLCYEYAKSLKGKMPPNLPGKGKVKKFLYQTLKIELIKMDDTNDFMETFISAAMKVIKEADRKRQKDHEGLTRRRKNQNV